MCILVFTIFCATLLFASIQVESCSNNYHFDYILLALQWPESFCEQNKCLPHQDKWSIHGSWPENNDGSWPQDCCTKQPFNASLLKPIESELLASWSSLKVGGSNNEFWSHEYSKHGTCAVESPLLKDELRYFKSTLEVFHTIHLDKWLADSHIVPSESRTYPVREIHEAVKQGLGHNVQIECSKSTIHHSSVVISQINVCLDKNTLKPFNCPLSDRGCKQTSIGYLPSH